MPDTPLTRLQRAYVAGRHPAYPWGGLPAHDHRVYAGPLDVARLREAWRAAVARHEMLRAVIDPELGTQRVLAEAPGDGIVVHDLRGAADAEVRAARAELAGRLSHEERPLDRWPLVGLEVLLTGDGADELHVSFDATVIDLASWWTVLDELTADYRATGSAQPAPRVGFAEHERVRAERERTGRPAEERVAALPPGPPVPPRYDAPPRVEINHSRLEPAEWRSLRDACRAAKVGETAFVLAVLAQVIAAWRETTRFTVSVPRAHRVPFHPDVARLVGPLSTVSLVPFDLRERRSLLDVTRATQRALWAELSEPETDGMALVSAFTARHGGPDRVAAPIVLTGLLGLRDPAKPVLGGLVETAVHTQNAQVALDVRFDRPAGALRMAWHERAGVFEPDEVAGVAAVTERVLSALAAGELDQAGEDAELRAAIARLLARVYQVLRA
ncbi:hypothetical protein GCM10023321_76900 [Pseudonocardia eucalypti]|uniref:Condensation domain-containing protein n=1 Tax=Pseudonocardia eucalypti TaxID=648755 RepID=A0ABP9RBQ2_9PSEU|nr:hypothetical protein [Pseudonocardia eucalypti]